MIISLCACSSSEFIDLSAFIDNYCEYYGKNELCFEDFTFTHSESSANYCAYFETDGGNILLSITSDEKDKISSCRVLTSKLDKNGKAKAITDDEMQGFLKVLRGTIYAFCHFQNDRIDSLLKEFSLNEKQSYSKQGELTKNEDAFHFVYYSTSLMSEMIITNERLSEVLPTEKPESKPYFAEAESIRTQTVPLR